MIVFSFFELVEEDCFGHAYVFHPCDVASPAQLQEGRKDKGPVYLDLCEEAERLTLQYSL